MPGPARVQHAHRLAPTSARQATPVHYLNAISQFNVEQQPAQIDGYTFDGSA